MQARHRRHRTLIELKELRRPPLRGHYAMAIGMNKKVIIPTVRRDTGKKMKP